MTAAPPRWRALAGWRSTLFLTAGPLVVVAMRRAWIADLTGLPEPLFWSLLPLGFALGLLGLVGFDPDLRGATPRLARFGRAIGLIGALALLVGLAVTALQRPPGPYPSGLGPIGLLYLLGFQAFILSAVAVGAGVWRTGDPSKRVGALLLALAAVQFAEQVFALVLVPVYGLSGEVVFTYQFWLYGVPMVVGLVATGYLLREGGSTPTPTDASEGTG